MDEKMHHLRIQFIHEEFCVAGSASGFEPPKRRRCTAVRTAHRGIRRGNASFFGVLHDNGQSAFSVTAVDLLLGIADGCGEMLSPANDGIHKDTVTVGYCPNLVMVRFRFSDL